MILDELMDLLDRPKHYGDYIMAMCPFHEDAYRPNLMVHDFWFKEGEYD
jgi:hypothetical protein